MEDGNGWKHLDEHLLAWRAEDRGMIELHRVQVRDACECECVFYSVRRVVLLKALMSVTKA